MIKIHTEPTSFSITNILHLWKKYSIYPLQEKILREIFRKYPQNTNENEILLKAKTLNLYYSTNVQAIVQMAKHIKNLKIDKHLKKGRLSIISDIANIKLENGKQRCFYSFATKYCNFHNPNSYPIYDSIVRKLLCQLNKHFKFYNNGKYTEQQLKICENYPEYKEMLDSFCHKFNIKLNYKMLDRYLWFWGKQLGLGSKQRT